MGKIIGKAKSIGKSHYLYAACYNIGLIGILLITYFRRDIVAEALKIDSWIETMYLLGTLLSLIVLSYMFLKKITRGLAVRVAGLLSIIIMIIYWISTSSAETFIETLRNFLAPFLAAFFIYVAIMTGIDVWPKIKSK